MNGGLSGLRLAGSNAGFRSPQLSLLPGDAFEPLRFDFEGQVGVLLKSDYRKHGLGPFDI